jgi:hypothetical protein
LYNILLGMMFRLVSDDEKEAIFTTVRDDNDNDNDKCIMINVL